MRSLQLDNVSSVCADKVILASTYDGFVNVLSPDLVHIDTKKYQEPILDTILHNDNIIASSSVGNLYVNDKKITTNCGGIEKIHVYNNYLLFGGWNNKICIYDKDNIVEINCNHKINYSCLRNNILGVADAANITFYDMRKYEKVLYEKCVKDLSCISFLEDNNKNSIQDIDGQGQKLPSNDFAYVYGTHSGKIRISNQQNESFTFNAHTKVSDNTKYLYKINDILTASRFISCGNDGKIYSWNLAKRKKLSCLYSGQKVIKITEYAKTLYFIDKTNDLDLLCSIELVD